VNTASHGNILNLRGIGGNRTLILFDGLRVPPTTFRGDVDTDVLPSGLVQRVEVVTAGASAAYGSDAIAGVVNFVLNKKFTGLTASAQYGISAQGDNPSYKLAAAGGFDVLGDAGHILLSAEHFDTGGMRRNERSITNQGYQFAGAVPGGGTVGSATNPYTIIANGRTILQAEGGLVTSGPFANQRFLPDGTLAPFIPGTLTGSPTFASGGDGFHQPYDASQNAPLNNDQLFGRFSMDVTPAVKAFVQGIFARSDLTYYALPNSASAPTSLATIFSGNPFLRPEVQAQLTSNNSASFGLSEFFGDAMGPNRTKERTDFYMVSTGLDGKFGSGWTWDVSYTHSRSAHHVDQFNVFETQKLFAALDAVRDPSGNIVCRPTLDPDPAVRQRYAGCVPFNPFGFRSYSAAAQNYVTGTSSYDATIKQDSVTANVQGNLIDLPAGPVAVAMGGEFRKQTLNLTSNADPALLDTAPERTAFFQGLRGVPASALKYFITNIGVANGSVSVKEGFAEIDVPVLKDTLLFQSFNLNAAGRVTDYSTSGTVATWKVGSTWRPVRDLLLRGTYSRDIRAPALFDLYAGDQFVISTLNDPVSKVGGQVPQINSGNRDLKPEKSKSLALGGVYSPRFLPGFAISVDYYRLKIAGAISSLTLTQIVENCALSGGTAPECAFITRPTPTSFPSSVRIAPGNIAFLQTSGIDFDASYRTGLAGGDLSLRLYANYLSSYKTQQSVVAPVYDIAGRANINSGAIVGRPRVRGTFNVNYSKHGFGLFVSEQYIGKFKLGTTEPNQVVLNPDVPAVLYTDLTLSQKISAGRGDFELFLTVNNLFDKQAPLIPAVSSGGSIPTITSLYDVVGRAFTVGARIKI
jgi:iron complex outermembrane receptor protein